MFYDVAAISILNYAKDIITMKDEKGCTTISSHYVTAVFFYYCSFIFINKKIKIEGLYHFIIVKCEWCVNEILQIEKKKSVYNKSLYGSYDSEKN